MIRWSCFHRRFLSWEQTALFLEPMLAGLTFRDDLDPVFFARTLTCFYFRTCHWSFTFV